MGSEERGEVVDEGRAFGVVDVDDEHGRVVFSSHLNYRDVARWVVEGLERFCWKNPFVDVYCSSRGLVRVRARRFYYRP